MKFLLFLLAFVPFIWTLSIQEIPDAQDRSISSMIVDAIEASKQQLPCGFPAIGIPPLAPFEISHLDVDKTIKSVKVFGQIDNFRLDGLNDFDIVELKVNAILSKVDFKFNWNHLSIDTDYELSTNLKPFNMKFSGKGKMALKNLSVWGTAKLSMGLTGGNIKMKTLDLHVKLDNVESDISGLSSIGFINRKLNKIIEEWLLTAINDSNDKIAEISNEHLVPEMNKHIGDRTLSDLLGVIAGGGQGQGSEGGERVPCVAARNYYLI